MRMVIAALALVLAPAVIPAPAEAQGRAPVYRYCLMDNSTRDSMGTMMCRFDTLAQCLASRLSFADTCHINPAYGRRR